MDALSKNLIIDILISRGKIFIIIDILISQDKL